MVRRLLLTICTLPLVLFTTHTWAGLAHPSWALEYLKLEKRSAEWPEKHRDVVVAVIDTGVDIDHSHLKDRLWTNTGESGMDSNGQDKSKNKIDDDNNGYIDDLHGWNFVNNNNNIKDTQGHGTHIAGIIIGHKMNNTHGVSLNAKVMVIKFYDPHMDKTTSIENSIRALEYAVKMKANIINYSGGGNESSPLEKHWIQQAEAQNILLVAAAGNGQSDNDKGGFYPASYGLSNIISVTAHDQKSEILPSSNFGKTSVQIAAPGKDIYSTTINNKFGLMTGTSQATAFVSGVAAEIIARSQRVLSPAEIIQRLTAPALKSLQLSKKIKYGALLSPDASLKTLTKN